mmetsp:Transcript_6205/g.21811  ORF Transcript_6205/g.21811 Transcript_6205/m.21811 type:complete len:214 (-) Transcript_6205:2-643(-)
MRKSTPFGCRCALVSCSILPRCAAPGTQFSTIELTTTLNSPPGARWKKSACSMRGCCDLRSTALTSSHGTESSCVFTAPTSRVLSGGSPRPGRIPSAVSCAKAHLAVRWRAVVRIEACWYASRPPRAAMAPLALAAPAASPEDSAAASSRVAAWKPLVTARARFMLRMPGPTRGAFLPFLPFLAMGRRAGGSHLGVEGPARGATAAPTRAGHI